MISLQKIGISTKINLTLGNKKKDILKNKNKELEEKNNFEFILEQEKRKIK